VNQLLYGEHDDPYTVFFASASIQPEGTQVTLVIPEVLLAQPATVEVVAYRVALEDLANMVRHVQTRKCTIRLTVSGNDLTVEVLDDGAGLPPAHYAGVEITG
jgi:signal transduction histidine kinase